MHGGRGLPVWIFAMLSTMEEEGGEKGGKKGGREGEEGKGGVGRVG